MIKGLVLGKFLPFHLGHKNLIEFASNLCDELTILICASDLEPILGAVRLNWIQKCFKNNPKVKPILFQYNEDDLPNTSVSSKEVSKIWSEAISCKFGCFDLIISSEKYGHYVADNLNAKHVLFDLKRKQTPISGSKILKNPYKYWDFLVPITKEYFVKKVVILGTESTGKSTLCKALALYFNTEYVPEMARFIIEKTTDVLPEHLNEISILHAQTIIETIQIANKILFIDTDVNITRSYSHFLFNKTLQVPNWVDSANKGDLYFYISADNQYIQDGTRLAEKERNNLAKSHLRELKNQNITFQTLSGSYDEILEQAINYSNDLLK